MQQDGGGGRQIKELLLPLSWGIWSHKCAHKSQTKVAPTESSVCVCRRMTVIGQGKILRKGTNRKGRQSQVIVACKNWSNISEFTTDAHKCKRCSQKIFEHNILNKIYKTVSPLYRKLVQNCNPVINDKMEDFFLGCGFKQ